MKGIKLEHFEHVVNSIASRHHIPDETRDEILTSQYAEDGTAERFHHSSCQTAGNNTFRYGVIVTRKNNEKMDLAYSVYSLAFRFPCDHLDKDPDKKKEFTLFGFTLASWCTGYIPKAKELSQSNQRYLKCILRLRPWNLLKGWITEHQNEIQIDFSVHHITTMSAVRIE